MPPPGSSAPAQRAHAGPSLADRAPDEANHPGPGVAPAERADRSPAVPSRVAPGQPLRHPARPARAAPLVDPNPAGPRLVQARYPGPSAAARHRGPGDPYPARREQTHRRPGGVESIPDAPAPGSRDVGAPDSAGRGSVRRRPIRPGPLGPGHVAAVPAGPVSPAGPVLDRPDPADQGLVDRGLGAGVPRAADRSSRRPVHRGVESGAAAQVPGGCRSVEQVSADPGPAR